MRKNISHIRKVLGAEGVAERWEESPIMKKIREEFGFLFFKSMDAKVRYMTSWKLPKMTHRFAGKSNENLSVCKKISSFKIFTFCMF